MKKTLRHHMLLILVLVLCAVFTLPVSASAKVQLNKTKVTLAAGKSTTLKLTGTKQKAKWSTNKKKIATVNQKGKVTAKAPGTCKITAKVGGKKYTCKVTVQQVTLRVMSSGSPVDTKQVVSLKKGKSLTLSIQQGTRMSKKEKYKYAKAKAKKVTWKSSAPGIISVSKSGKITAKKTGQATITAKYSGKKISFTVKGTKKKTDVPFLKEETVYKITYWHNFSMNDPFPVTVESDRVGYYSDGKLIPEPVEKGYFFDGWYDDSLDINDHNPKAKHYKVGTVVDKDIDLFAKWSRKLRVSFANQPNQVQRTTDFRQYNEAGNEMPIYRAGDTYDVYIREGTSLRDNVGKKGTNMPKGWTLDTAMKNAKPADPDDPYAIFDGWYVPDTSGEYVDASVCLICGERFMPLDGDIADGMSLDESYESAMIRLHFEHCNFNATHEMYYQELVDIDKKYWGGDGFVLGTNYDNVTNLHVSSEDVSRYYKPMKLTMDTIITSRMFDPYVKGVAPGTKQSPYYHPDDPYDINDSGSWDRHSWCDPSYNPDEQYVKVSAHFSNPLRTVTFDAAPGHIKGSQDAVKKMSVVFEETIWPEDVPEAERDDGAKFLGWTCNTYCNGDLVFPPSLDPDKIGEGVYIVTQDLTFTPVWDATATLHFEIDVVDLAKGILNNESGQEVLFLNIKVPLEGELTEDMLPEVIMQNSNYVFRGWYEQTGGQGNKLECPVKISADKTWYAFFETS